ncbi:MAG: hypothetical protein ACR2G3_06400 [Solirubrobacterales bacterium]
MKLTLSAILIAAALALAACGGDDEGEATTTTTVSEGATGATGASGASGEEGSEGAPCAEAESPPNITKVTAYGADCEAVEDAMGELGSVSTKFELGDFDCERTAGSELSGSWRCHGEAGYFTFQFAD